MIINSEVTVYQVIGFLKTYDEVHRILAPMYAVMRHEDSHLTAPSVQDYVLTSLQKEIQIW